MKRKVIIGVVIGVLVIVVAGIAYAAYAVIQKGEEQARQAEVMAISREIDEDLDTIWGRLAGRDAAWQAQVDSGMDDLDSVINASRTDLGSITDEVKSLREKAETIPSQKVSDAYVAVCDELEEALTSSLASLDKAAPIGQAYVLIETAADDANDGLEAANNAIDFCNRKKYSDAKASAKTAQTHYEAMRKKFVDASALHTTTYDAALLDYANACVEYAKMVHQLGVLGTQGSINGYNSQIDKMDKQFQKCSDLADNVADAAGAMGGDIAITHGNLVMDATAAKSLWNKAKKIVAAGEY